MMVNTVRLMMICLAVQLMSSAVFSKAADPNQTPSDPNRLAASKATFDEVLKQWAAGQKEEALAAFIALNWTGQEIFADGSVFRISEAEFAKMPQAKRDPIGQKALEASKQIRELARYAVDKAKQTGQTAKYRQALSACAKRLSSPDQLKLIQLIGKAVGGLTEKELPASAG